MKKKKCVREKKDDNRKENKTEGRERTKKSWKEERSQSTIITLTNKGNRKQKMRRTIEGEIIERSKKKRDDK